MNLARRLWVYQAERFPLQLYTVLMAALVIGAAGFGTAGAAWPAPAVLLVDFGVALSAFALLRIADEFKDAATDAAHRAYRPVPRGLVSLRELAGVGIGAGVGQLVLTVGLDLRLLPYLLAIWLVMGLMAREYFMGPWLQANPLIYMLSHMLILPMIMLYLLAAAWRPVGEPPAGLGWFLAASYANGVVFEIGRKLRAPAQEEPGVETYSALWGPGRAAAVWLAAVVAAGLAGWAAGYAAGNGAPLLFVGIILGGGAGWVARRMARQPNPRHSQWIEIASALWVLGLYLALGIAPHAL